MKHTIDLSKYRIRTDLAIDYLEDENIKNYINIHKNNLSDKNIDR